MVEHQNLINPAPIIEKISISRMPSDALKSEILSKNLITHENFVNHTSRIDTNINHNPIVSLREAIALKRGLDYVDSVPLTDRMPLEQLEVLGITWDDLGTRTLDIGSGASEALSKQASLHKKTADSLNPKLRNQDKNRARVFEPYRNIPWQHRSVAAVAEALPFADSSYDTVLSCFAAIFWTHPEDLPVVLSEVLRVLKPGGKAYLGPIADAINTEKQNLVKAILGHMNMEPGKDFEIKKGVEGAVLILRKPEERD